ncbi:MAG TPA: Ig-like domain-containing protein, partial [Acidisphaera sp.]|nr:Ig-like domain-containing protein [Acidisphaera sp.]
QPLVDVHATPGDAMAVTEQGNPITFVGTSDASGDWVFTPTTPLAVGTHTLLATVTDGLGDTATTPLDVTILAAAHVAIDGLVDGTAEASGATTDQTPTLFGTGTPGQTVTLRADGTPIGSTVADGSGNWSFTSPYALSVGAHNITATVSEGTGDTASASFGLTIDTPVTVASNLPLGSAAAAAIAGLLGSGGAADVVYLQPGQTLDLSGLPNGALAALDVSNGQVGETITVPSIDEMITNNADGPVTVQGSGQPQVVVSTGPNFTYLTGGADGVFLGQANANGSYGNNTVLIPAGARGHFIVEAGGGDNIIVAASGDNSVSGGAGANLIVVGTGSNVVDSGGADTIIGGAGAATVTAGAGDTATGLNSDLLFMEGGQMTFINAHGASTLTGGPGSATVHAGAGGGAYWGGTNGDNVMIAGSGAATLFGGGNDDFLSAGSHRGNDVLVAAASRGNSTLTAATSSGDNVILTRRQDALVYGGAGADTIVGGSGQSTVHAGTGQDLIFTGKGSDTVYGGRGASTVASGSAADTIHGGRGDMMGTTPKAANSSRARATPPWPAAACRCSTSSTATQAAR